MEWDCTNHYNCIYLIRCKLNNKIYIGKTSNFKHRLWTHKSIQKSNPNLNKLYQEVERIGWDNFTHEILIENVDPKKLGDLERVFIKQYDSINNGYNVDVGGNAQLNIEGKTHRKVLKYGINDCKSKEWKQKYYQEHAEKLREYQRKYRTTDRYKEYHKKYDKEHRDQKENYAKLIGKDPDYYKKYRLEHAEKLREYQRKYRQEHLEHIKEIERKSRNKNKS